MLEEILVNDVYDAVELLLKEKIISKFYFVRYFDEGFHLRLRFCLIRNSDYVKVLDLFRQKLNYCLQNSLITKLVVDVYEREIERYGNDFILTAETLFSISSLKIMEIFRSTADFNNRLIAGIVILDQLLNNFNFSYIKKHIFFKDYFNIYKNEFSTNRIVLQKLDGKYRSYRNSIVRAIESSGSNLIESFGTRLEVNQLKLDCKIDIDINWYNNDRDDVIRSLVHMHFNRLFRTRQRFHEFVLYFILSKVYRTLDVKYGESFGKSDLVL